MTSVGESTLSRTGQDDKQQRFRDHDFDVAFIKLPKNASSVIIKEKNKGNSILNIHPGTPGVLLNTFEYFFVLLCTDLLFYTFYSFLLAAIYGTLVSTFEYL